MIRADGFFVIGSGAGAKLEADGSLRIQVSTIGKRPDANGNVEASPNASQVQAFMLWLAEEWTKIDPDAVARWREVDAERVRERVRRLGRPGGAP